MLLTMQVKAEEAKTCDKVVYDGDPVKEQILWPPHCIQDSWGAELHPDLKVGTLPDLPAKRSSVFVEICSETCFSHLSVTVFLIEGHKQLSKMSIDCYRHE